MRLDDFINKWDGRGIDYDNYYGDQCMDLMHQYISEVLGLPDGRILQAPAAKDVYLNFDNIFGREYFEKVPNTPEGVPQPGDIVLWGTGLGPYGHVAIFIDGNASTFNSFDQNFPIGSKCHIQSHTYKGVLGWLHPKKQSDQAELDKVRVERDKNWNLYQEALTLQNNLREERDNNYNLFKAKEKESIDFQQQNVSLMAENAKLKEDLAKCQQKPPTTNPGAPEPISNTLLERLSKFLKRFGF